MTHNNIVPFIFFLKRVVTGEVEKKENKRKSERKNKKKKAEIRVRKDKKGARTLKKEQKKRR